MTTHKSSRKARRRLTRMGELIDRLRWAAALWLSPLKPIAGGGDGEGGEAGAEGDSGGEGEGDGKPADSDAGSGDKGEGDGEDDKPFDREADAPAEPDWKREARKHENRAKKLARENERFKREQEEHRKQQQSDHERAIEEARAEGERKARETAERERRADRLENAVIRTAAKGVTIKDGDEEQTIRFQDPEDAMLHLERAISRDEVDGDDIFNDQGRVNNDAVAEALADLLKAKPYLRAGDEGEKPKPPQPQGSANGGEGSGDSEDGKALEDMSPDDHFRRIRRNPDDPKIRDISATGGRTK